MFGVIDGARVRDDRYSSPVDLIVPLVAFKPLNCSHDEGHVVAV